MYSENLPSPNYKTRRFERTIRETYPEDISKEDFLKLADKQQTICETLVKNDVQRHINEINAS